MVCTPPRNGARGRLQASESLPPVRGSRQGRSPARERGRPARNLISGWRRWSDSARLPAGSHPAGVNRDGQAQWERSTGRWFRCALFGGGVDGRLFAGIWMRAGRPRSRVGILHTTNRDHGLHHAQDWGKGPFASLSITPPVRGIGPGRSPARERGRSARNHPGTRASRPQPYFWLEVTNRQRNVAGRQPPCRHERRWPGSMGEIHWRVV